MPKNVISNDFMPNGTQHPSKNYQFCLPRRYDLVWMFCNRDQESTQRSTHKTRRRRTHTCSRVWQSLGRAARETTKSKPPKDCESGISFLDRVQKHFFNNFTYVFTRTSGDVALAKLCLLLLMWTHWKKLFFRVLFGNWTRCGQRRVIAPRQLNELSPRWCDFGFEMQNWELFCEGFFGKRVQKMETIRLTNL